MQWKRPGRFTENAVKILTSSLGIAFVCVFLYFLFLNLLHLLAHQQHLNFHYDFGFFYWAFSAVWHHHAASLMYHPILEQRWMGSLGYPVYPENQYVYPPQFAVMFCWLAAVPYRIASAAWFLMAVCGVGVSIQLLLQIAFTGTYGWRRRSKIDRILPCGFVLAWLVANDGLYSDITIGNVTWLLFTLLCIAFYLRYQKDRRLPAGFLIGVAAVVKVTPAVLIGYYALRRDWRMVGGIFLGIATTTALTVTVVGWRLVWVFVSGFSSLVGASMKNGPAPYNLSVKGVLMWINQGLRLGWHPGSIHFMFMVYLILLAMLVVWLARPARILDPRLEMMLAPCCILLFSPLIEGTHLLLFAIAFVMVFSVWWESRMLRTGQLRVRDWLWMAQFTVAAVCLSTIREVLEGVTRGFPLLFIGYALLAVSTLHCAGRWRGGSVIVRQVERSEQSTV